MIEPDSPKCPKCGQPMESRKLTIDPLIYIHACSACNVIASTDIGGTTFEDAPWIERYKK